MARGLIAADAAAVAASVQTLAVLLQAGVAPARAWEHLASTGDESARRVAAALRAGASLETAIADHAPPPAFAGRRPRRSGDAGAAVQAAWRDTAAATAIATTVGAPLASSLRSIASAVRDTHEAADDIRVALAEPASTARLMGWLPLVAVGLGFALGFDVIGVLSTTPFGAACLAGGIVLVWLAQMWSRALVRQATAETDIAGLESELVAIALSGGASIDRARALVGAYASTETSATTDSVLALSASAGIPAVELLRASSALARHRARVDAKLRAARLSTRLLLPLGVCTLPAFLLLGIAPMLLSVLSVVPAAL